MLTLVHQKLKDEGSVECNLLPEVKVGAKMFSVLKR